MAYSLTFLLQQHTPLAHFQHFQTDDATLRATELRPALDRYLIEKVFNNQLNAFTGKGWLLALDEKKAAKLPSELQETGETYVWSFKNRLAFDYKMRIEPLGEVAGFHKINDSLKSGKYVADFPMLLSNMGGKEEKNDLKNFALHKGVAVTIQTRHSELLKEIKSALPALVARENFGNRSSKGFGSFTCIRVENEDVQTKMPFRYHFICDVSDMDTISYPLKRNEERQAPRNEFERQKSLFTIIDLFYKTLRSGINYGHKDFYFKSLLFRYVKDELKKQWDKRTIKEKYFVGDSTKHEHNHRDFLGLSTIEKWGIRATKKDFWTKEPGEITKELVAPPNADEDEKFVRFPSPVIFKPVRLDENRFNVWFDLRVDMKSVQQYKQQVIAVKKNGEGNLTLKPSPDFDLQGFFDFIFKDMDIETLDSHVEDFDEFGLNCRENHIYTRTLRPIFNQIYNNLQPKNQ